MRELDRLMEILTGRGEKHVYIGDARLDHIKKAKHANEKVIEVADKYKELIKQEVRKIEESHEEISLGGVLQKLEADYNEEMAPIAFECEDIWTEIYEHLKIPSDGAYTLDSKTGKVFQVVLPGEPGYDNVEDQSHLLSD